MTETVTDPPVAGAAFAMHDVTVTFGGITALDHVGLTARPHEVLGVIGPNGAGKTTLFNVACGFVRPDEGRLTWRDRELVALRPHQLAGHGIGRTLQGLGLFDRMSVVENVMVGARGRAGFLASLLALPRAGRDERALRERAMATLSELGIADHADRLPPALPYAVRKRVALARALVAEPELLLLDEPASGLSDRERDDLGELVVGLRERMAVMLVEHHMDLVMQVCDTVVVLDFGKVIAAGPPGRIRTDPAVQAAYLGDEVETVDPTDAASTGSPAAGEARR